MKNAIFVLHMRNLFPYKLTALINLENSASLRLSIIFIESEIPRSFRFIFCLEQREREKKKFPLFLTLFGCIAWNFYFFPLINFQHLAIFFFFSGSPFQAPFFLLRPIPLYETAPLLSKLLSVSDPTVLHLSHSSLKDEC